MRSRPNWVRATLAAGALGAVMVMPQAAGAHPVSMTTNWMAGGRAGFCVQASVQQEHAWHNNSTFATNCNNLVRADHWQYEEFYKVRQWGQPGIYCFNNGPFQDSNTTDMTKFWGWDIGARCNDNGLWEWVTIDSWQYAAPSGTGAWFGGALRPATNHCHCP